VDVYLNGSHLSPADFTATNGSDVVLAVAASADDVCDIISYTPFEVADQTFTGTTTMDVVAIAGDTTFADGADIITASAGTSNFRAGVNAGNSIASGGNYNVTVGDEAGTALTVGDESVAVGFEALMTATSGAENVGIGYRALKLTTGNSNVAVGKNALATNSSASNNTAVGTSALTANTTGASNVAVGKDALLVNTEGVNNTAVGHLAGSAMIAGGACTFIGEGAGLGTTADKNTFLGDSSGFYVTSGQKNTILGRYNGNENGLDIRTSSNNIVLSDGDGNPRVIVDSTGAVTMPAQPAFLATPANSDQTNLASGTHTVVLGTEIFDQNADFASNTFTAPVAGRYQLNAIFALRSLDTAATYYIMQIATSNRNYEIQIAAANMFANDGNFYFNISALADMDASDTAAMKVITTGGTAQTDINADSRFSGFLAC